MVKETRIEFLTVAEVAAKLKVSQRTVLNWIEKRKLVAMNFATGSRRGFYRVPVEEVNRLIGERTAA